MRYVIVYVGVCFTMGIIGMNRKLGFWGYFSISLLLTPLAGVVMFLASDSKYRRQATSGLSAQQRGAIDYGYKQAIENCKNRIQALIDSHRITPEYATAELEPLVEQLADTLRFARNKNPTSPLDKILDALEHLPAPGAGSPDGPAENDEEDPSAADDNNGERAQEHEALPASTTRPGSQQSDRDAE